MHTGWMPTGRPIWRAVKRCAAWMTALVLAAAAAAVLSACATGGAGATSASGRLAVAPTGDDANSCSESSPCRTFDHAYHVAQPGQVVVVAPGSYAEQKLTPDSTKTSIADVVFRAAVRASVTVAGLSVHGSHITFQNMTLNGDWQTYHETRDVTFRRLVVHGAIFTQSSSNIRVLGGSVGGVVDTKPQFGAWPPNTTNRNIVIDGVTFHDVTRSGDFQHVECLLIAGIDGLMIRNSRFYNCDVFDVSLGEMNGSGPPRNITIENNFFGGADGYFSLDFNSNTTSFTNVLIRNNSSTQAMYLGNDIRKLKNVRVIANVAPNKPGACDDRIFYSHNVWAGTRCSATDRNAPLGFRNPAVGDFHLRKGAAAIGHGDPRNFPKTDIDGRKRQRGKRVDAGAAQWR
jgi:hypothetical protein